jgi:hypothetical protein
MTPKQWLENTSQDGVYYIGHASALARVSGKILLFDPVWNHKPYGENWEFIPEQKNADDILDQVDAVFVSHIHSDHYSPAILSKVRCPIFIMEGRPNLTARMSSYNKNVVTYPHSQWIKSDLGFDFYFQPHTFNSIDSSVFVKNSDFCMYHGNDNFLTPEALNKLKSVIPKVDVAMVPYAFIHWYPHLMTEVTEEWRQTETDRLNKLCLDQAKDFLNILNVKTAIPFGSALFFAEGPDHILNRTLSLPHDFTGALPIVAGGWVMADGSHSTPPTRDEYLKLLETLPLDVVSERILKATPVPNHELIVNDVVVDLETLKVFRRSDMGKKPFTQFTFEPMIYRQWLKGEITFEEAVGSRRFRCQREPNAYNLKVFEFMNNYL